MRPLPERIREHGTGPAIFACLLTLFAGAVLALTTASRATTDFERLALAILPCAGALVATLVLYIFRGSALQRAVADRGALPEGLCAGAVYVRAGDPAVAGSDVFDIQRGFGSRGYVLVADASANGADAAHDAAFLKFTVRALVRQFATPDAVLGALDELFREHARQGAFASVFLGMFDFERSRLAYSSAGHVGAWLRRDREVGSLPQTGPVIGLAPEAKFGRRTVAFVPGDLLVVATDGLTQAAAPGGDRLTVDNAGVWIAHSAAHVPQALVDDIAARARRYAGGAPRDDLTILALRNDAPAKVPGPAVERPPRARNTPPRPARVRV